MVQIGSWSRIRLSNCAEGYYRGLRQSQAVLGKKGAVRHPGGQATGLNGQAFQRTRNKETSVVPSSLA